MTGQPFIPTIIKAPRRVRDDGSNENKLIDIDERKMKDIPIKKLAINMNNIFE